MVLNRDSIFLSFNFGFKMMIDITWNWGMENYLFEDMKFSGKKFGDSFLWAEIDTTIQWKLMTVKQVQMSYEFDYIRSSYINFIYVAREYKYRYCIYISLLTYYLTLKITGTSWIFNLYSESLKTHASTSSSIYVILCVTCIDTLE